MSITKPTRAVKIFYCYAREDSSLRDALGMHLSVLKRTGKITEWYDRYIQAGIEWEHKIDKHIGTSDIILLLVSRYFIASDYCYGVEMKQALERHASRQARVIPIILRPANWKDTPIGKLQALPRDGKPITLWRNRDEVLSDVVNGICDVVESLLSQEIGEPEIGEDHVDIHTKPVFKQVGKSVIVDPEQNDQNPKYFPYLSRRKIVVGTAGLVISGGALSALSFMRFPSRHLYSLSTPTPVGKTIYTYTKHSSAVFSVAWSPDGTHIASGGKDDTVQVWNTVNGNPVWLYHSPDIITFVSWSYDGKRIAAAGYDRTVRVWGVVNSTAILTYSKHTQQVNCVAWSHDNKLIASTSLDGTVQIWDATSGDRIRSISVSSMTWGVTWSPDDRFIAFGCEDHTVQIWNAINGKHIWTYQGHSDKVRYVAWSPDGSRIASGSYDKTVQVWNVADEKREIVYRGHSEVVFGITWSPDGTRIASGSHDATAQVWSAKDGNPIFVYRGHSFGVYPVSWSHDSTRIASGGVDTTVQIWKAP